MVSVSDDRLRVALLLLGWTPDTGDDAGDWWLGGLRTRLWLFSPSSCANCSRHDGWELHNGATQESWHDPDPMELLRKAGLIHAAERTAET